MSHHSASQKQVEANKRNAQKSTGPKSAAGKRAVSANAVTHGLLARRISFNNDHEEARFNSLMERLEEKYRPDGPVEEILLEELGVTWWGIQNCTKWELRELKFRRKVSQDIFERLKQTVDSERSLFNLEPNYEQPGPR